MLDEEDSQSNNTKSKLNDVESGEIPITMPPRSEHVRASTANAFNIQLTNTELRGTFGQRTGDIGFLPSTIIVFLLGEIGDSPAYSGSTWMVR